MKMITPVFFSLVLQSATVSANEQIVTLGDSLSFAYEAEFCFTKTVTGVGTIGDNMPQTTRNWIEILSNPIYRGDRFELGARDSVTVTPPSADPPFTLYFRQGYNWSIPGTKVHDLRQFLAGQATFTSIINSDPDFSTLSSLLPYSDFNDATDFALPDLESQIQATAERVTVMIGGNDIKAAYGPIYDGTSSGEAFVNDFMVDLTAILDRLQTLNPNIQIVVANVPHVGITPRIRTSWPYDVVKTERVSAVLRDLNSRIAALVATRNLGLADLYTATLSMLSGTMKLCIHGVTFVVDGTSSGNVSGNLGNVWLNGPISKNFHPHTCAQAVIANEVIRAFNNRYHTGIAPLSATEMLVGLLAKTASSIDIAYANWILRFVPSAPPASDDSDGDGIPAGMEFALGLNPARNDSDLMSSGIVGSNMELAYPTRLPTSTQYTLVPESSTSLTTPFTPFATPPVQAADGLFHAKLPLGAARGFLHLKAVLTP